MSAPAPKMTIGARAIGPGHRPLVIAELGINHDGDLDRMHRMIDDAADAGVECVKFQSHVVEDEMIPNDVVPGNADESIYTMMQRCALSAAEEKDVFAHAHDRGLIALSTPFSRAAADRLAGLDVPAFKIGSGECNNYPLVRHIASFGKPVLLSTGMNDVSTIRPSVELLRSAGVPFALMHCTSLYPTPPEKVRLGGITELQEAFPDAVLGLSDHTTSIYACLGGVAVGADVLERHFTSDLSWPGPDIPISSLPADFGRLVEGADVLAAARGGRKEILPEEQPTIDFAYACVVTTARVTAGEPFGVDNVWVKRPGTGELKAVDYDAVLGRVAARDLPADVQLSWADLAAG
ncbi:N-acetylneuraminate synthase family protein [Blastococcus sp. VKM Ac-2987]|uniref:N-acetylneuraminate synthase family protein n=1 Tax=Blastococcus sp. VKM Ac-2987 TaxID=3004141 RepID=UPI0022AB57A5|nr:N-acetylneuraminate synthase family protein [Blastococcus sp. VKM Ac-2987]MCZ2859541.1 N-acetylneuraminate synthase family protein [Blastococcus sp. VKM Ac-2987]